MPSRAAISIALATATTLTAGALYAHHVAETRRTARAAAALSNAVVRGSLVLHVPHATAPITLDGDTDDKGWLLPPGPARTGDFRMAGGEAARPYSHARLVWSGDFLYLALYASDEDIESRVDAPDAPPGPNDDTFRVVFSNGDAEYAFDLSPAAVLTDATRHAGGEWDRSWNSGAHASREIDGTMNDPKNLDEEWEIELAVPLASLGLAAERGENIAMSLHRCDTPKRSPRVCSGWGDGEDGRGLARIVLD